MLHRMSNISLCIIMFISYEPVRFMFIWHDVDCCRSSHLARGLQIRNVIFKSLTLFVNIWPVIGPACGPVTGRVERSAPGPSGRAEYKAWLCLATVDMV